MGGNATVNPLYLLRYHVEMNELSIDAQLNFEKDESSLGQGEIWSCSSCPLDSKLVLTCRSIHNGDASFSSPLAQAETAIWRIPEGAFRQDDLDFYPEERDYDRDNKAFDELNETMSKVCLLDLGPGRVTDMQWNPGCMPSCEDEFGESLSTPNVSPMAVGYNLLTVQNAGSGQGNGRGKKVVVTTWDIGTTSCNSATANKVDTVDLIIPMDRGFMPNPPKASWDPHNQNLCAVTLGTNIAILDMRAPTRPSHGLKCCHRFGVTDVDYNPKKPNILVSSGQDALVKFWDLRFTSSNDIHHDESAEDHSTWSRQCPIKLLRGGHTHWTTCVKYNPYHDQLLLSAGTDSVVNLWRISSISSAPLLDLGDDGKENDSFEKRRNNDPIAAAAENGGVDDSFDDMINDNSFDDDTDSQDTEYGHDRPDVRVTMMEMREAVYDVCWSAADPWLYVSLGYDGNVVLNHVPSKEKYKILL
jgi:WD40 repeat protein